MTERSLVVVVPTRDRPEQLARCLAALAAELGPADRVVVVDSASTRQEEVAQAAADGGAMLVRCERKGASRARNAGWRASDAALVAFVDDDMQVHAGWAGALVSGVSGPDVGFVSGRTVAAEGSGSAVGSVTWGRPEDVIDRRTRGAFAASNNLLVTREALNRTGGFDERLGPGTWLEAGEDLELLDRVLTLGWTGRYVHEAVADHEQWRSAAQWRRLQLAYGKGNGARLASLVLRDRRRARLLAPELLRLGGLRTAAVRVTGGRAATTSDASLSPPSTGWAAPLLWRLGGIVGLLVGLVVLRGPDRPGRLRG